MCAVQCIECPRGSICNISGLVGDELIAQDGWWRTDNNTLDEVGFLPCLQPGNCVSGACAPHRVGPLCAVCEVGYTASSQSADCTKCPEYVWLLLYVLSLRLPHSCLPAPSSAMYRRTTAVGATAGFSILLAAGLLLILTFVWRSESLTPRVVHKKAIKIKAYTPEYRSSPNYAYSFKLLVTYVLLPAPLFPCLFAALRCILHLITCALSCDSYLQITTSLFGLVNMPWPSAFSAFLKYFSCTLNSVPLSSLFAPLFAAHASSW